MKSRSTYIVVVLMLGFACTSQHQTLWDDSRTELQAYRTELVSMREEFRVCEMPDVPFFLFGMGDRTKFVYKQGKLIESLSGNIVHEWQVAEELIVPSLYRVLIKTTDGKTVLVEEDEQAVWLSENGASRVSVAGTEFPLSLPDFSNHRYARILKVLHQEILINILDGTPLPNYFVYKNGWRRDGAMMGLCLEKTGNVDLIKPWVLNFSSPYDRNNANEEEADNLGQTLYLISLFADKEHPVVKNTLEEVKRYERKNEQGIFIQGRSDFHETPVYQTKFLKWGLSKLGLPDDYIIPQVEDNYATLFWWDYKEAHFSYTNGPEGSAGSDKYPYLGWAADHFYGLKRNPISNRDYPLTWEIEASQANYEGMRIIDEQYVAQRNASPHTWHAAEVFLYLLDEKFYQ